MNCPFDRPYQSLFHSLVFVVHDCGFVARSALEISDFGEPRIQKITRLIGECPLAIHDISRTQLDPATRLPRFNMPLELGLFLGARFFGNAEQRQKRGLVLDSNRYRYQKYCSDVAGQDICAHGNSVKTLIGVVRNWLNQIDAGTQKPGGSVVFKRFRRFQKMLPTMCQTLRESPDTLSYNDYAMFVVTWLTANSPRSPAGP